MTINEAAEREAFEKYVTENWQPSGGYSNRLERAPEGYYREHLVNVGWSLWQARAQQAQQPSDVVERAKLRVMNVEVPGFRDEDKLLGELFGDQIIEEIAKAALSAMQQPAIGFDVAAVLRNIHYWASAAAKAETKADAVFYAANARNHCDNAIHALSDQPAATIKTDNTQALYNALERIKELEAQLSQRPCPHANGYITVTSGNRHCRDCCEKEQTSDVVEPIQCHCGYAYHHEGLDGYWKISCVNLNCGIELEAPTEAELLAKWEGYQAALTAVQQPAETQYAVQPIHLKKIGFTCERTGKRWTFTSMTDFIMAFLKAQKQIDEQPTAPAGALTEECICIDANNPACSIHGYGEGLTENEAVKIMVAAMPLGTEQTNTRNAVSAFRAITAAMAKKAGGV